MGRRGRFSDDPFGTTVEGLLRESGTTYRELADRTGLSAGYLNHLVHGNRPVPSNDVMGTLAKALGVEADHFLEFRVRVIAEQLQQAPGDANRLYRRYRG